MGGCFDPQAFLSDKVRAMDGSGARLLFELTSRIQDPADLSIGQPDFGVPEGVRRAAVDAIAAGASRYTGPEGDPELQQKIAKGIENEFPDWRIATGVDDPRGFATLVTTGVSGGLVLACLSCLGPGDEVLIPDPYFLSYPHLATLTGATPVYIDTYPDFRVSAERIARLLSPRTKLLLLNSPSNPTGAVVEPSECRAIAQLAERHGFLVLSDEIYDEFCYAGVERGGRRRAPSVASYTRRAIVLRGFSKTYGMPGWRLGYAVGPAPIIDKMTQLTLLFFVCAPSLVQRAGLAALGVDMSKTLARYQSRRDRLLAQLSGSYEIQAPGGAFYLFARVPEQLGLTGTQFVAKAMFEHKLLLIPGSAFSLRDTHARISYACDDATLERGASALLALAAGREGE